VLSEDLPADDRRPSARLRLDILTAELTVAFLSSLRAGDDAAAESVLRRALASSVEPAVALTRVVQPAMEQIGVHWEQGAMSVADEHLASGVCQRALAAIHPLLIAHAEPNGVRVVLAGVRGQLHSLGLRMVCDVLDGLGYETVYLGPDTPSDAVADAVLRHSPRLVALSLTLPQDVVELEHAVAAVAAADPTVSVMIGGLGIPERLRDYSGYAVDAEHVDDVARLLLARDAMLPCPTMALTDPVTGLPNRRAWDERFADAALSPDLAVLILDLDGFKAYNDRAGHLAGDGVLTRVGEVIRGVLRAEDFVARLGGDEFGVLLPLTDTRTAMAIADRACVAIGDALDAAVTASIGVASYAISPRATTLSADQALYRAKAEGGNRAELAA